MAQVTSTAMASIRIDGGTQPRTAISEETVANYAEHMRGMAPQFPPIVVFFDGVDHWLADGFHRYHAAKNIGRTELDAVIHGGTRRDAVLFAAGANQTHGLPRTNADKRKAVMTLLEDAEWQQWSNNEIGRRCGVSPHTVAGVRSDLVTMQTHSERPQRTFTTKHGTTAMMQTENIGKKKMPDRSPGAALERRDRLRAMASEGYTSRQMAPALGISEEGCRDILRAENIDVPADRILRKTRRHDANRIVGRMVLQAEGLVADVELIKFGELDQEQLPEWLRSLESSRKALGVFIRRLMKERQKHVEAA